MTLDVALIRHGQIQINGKWRLIGISDYPVGGEGERIIGRKREAGAYPDVDIVYTSGMRRCVETAKLIYFSRKTILTEDGFCSPDYGDFDGREFSELGNDEAFKKWWTSPAAVACPNGEDLEDFSARVRGAFQKVCGYAASEGFESLAIVSHRVVIAEILERYYAPRSKYMDWDIPPSCGYLLRYDTETISARIIDKF